MFNYDLMPKKEIRRLLQDKGLSRGQVQQMFTRGRFTAQAITYITAELSRRNIKFTEEDLGYGDTTTEDTV